jgi:hypothetical protein
MDYLTAGYVGAASVAGLYLARNLNGIGGSPSMNQMVMVFGTSAASTLVAPMISNTLVCPHSPGAPLVEAGASAGVSFGALYALGDREGAAMFIPVQIGAYIVGSMAARYMRTMSTTKSSVNEDLGAAGISGMP